MTKSPRFEAHASPGGGWAGAAWLAWDESGANWGKDWFHEDQNRSTVLYADRSIRVVVKDGGVWKQAGDFSTAVNERLLRYWQLPHLAVDGGGRVWALFQIRTSATNQRDDFWCSGGLWDLYLTTFDNGAWRPASFVPDSDGTQRAAVPDRRRGRSCVDDLAQQQYVTERGQQRHPAAPGLQNGWSRLSSTTLTPMPERQLELVWARCCSCGAIRRAPRRGRLFNINNAYRRQRQQEKRTHTERCSRAHQQHARARAHQRGKQLGHVRVRVPAHPFPNSKFIVTTPHHTIVRFLCGRCQAVSASSATASGRRSCAGRAARCSRHRR